MAQGRDIQPLESAGLGSSVEPCLTEARVSVPIVQILPWLAEAAANGVTWLRDFEDEEISISSDLHDVILAYQHFHQR